MIPKLNEIFRKTIELIKDALNRAWRVADQLQARYFIRSRVTTFMTTHGVPGVSVAIAYKGRLVFSKGYGFADKSTNDPVTANHLFRIASLSKPLTAVAVFRLLEEWWVASDVEHRDGGGGSGPVLRLDEPVFGPGAILGTIYGTPPPNSDIDKITVRHLLEHTSGWSNTPTDIMTAPDSSLTMSTWQNMTQGDLITWMVTKRGLAHKPGIKFEYLNFGYLVLGRVIEARSGMPYADYVRQAVLAPCGISDMHIAGNTLADRRPNEVRYYPGPGSTQDPYALLVSRMDAHGGWIASPTDLVRFLVHVDGFPTPPDILTSSSITTMVTPTTATRVVGRGWRIPPTNYAKGWAVHSTVPAGQDNYWHVGDLPGTTAFFVRTTDQYCFAVLANSRDDATDAALRQIRDDIDQLWWDIKKDVEGLGNPDLVWPISTPL